MSTYHHLCYKQVRKLLKKKKKTYRIRRHPEDWSSLLRISYDLLVDFNHLKISSIISVKYFGETLLCLYLCLFHRCHDHQTAMLYTRPVPSVKFPLFSILRFIYPVSLPLLQKVLSVSLNSVILFVHLSSLFQLEPTQFPLRLAILAMASKTSLVLFTSVFETCTFKK